MVNRFLKFVDRMENLWKSALEAAEKAKTVAKSVSQKGIVSSMQAILD